MPYFLVGDVYAVKTWLMKPIPLRNMTHAVCSTTDCPEPEQLCRMRLALPLSCVDSIRVCLQGKLQLHFLLTVTASASFVPIHYAYSTNPSRIAAPEHMLRSAASVHRCEMGIRINSITTTSVSRHLSTYSH